MAELASLQLDLDLLRGEAGLAWRFLVDARFWGIVIAIIAPAFAAAALANLIRRDRRRGGPAARLMARALRLGRGERQILDQLARRSDLPGAACLTISRGCFDHAAALEPARSGDPAVDRLRRRLFDQPVHFGDDDDS